MLEIVGFSYLYLGCNVYETIFLFICNLHIWLISLACSWTKLSFCLQEKKKCLVLREIPVDRVKKLLSNKESLAACDVAVFVHDGDH